MRKLLAVTTPEEKAPLFVGLRATLERGDRAIIGSLEAMHVRAPIGKVGEKFLVVKCRSTREEFLACAPADADKANVERSPFYYELELGD